MFAFWFYFGGVFSVHLLPRIHTVGLHYLGQGQPDRDVAPVATEQAEHSPAIIWSNCTHLDVGKAAAFTA